MKLLHCELELHENLFFATREMGRLYECESYLHNYALSYALGLVAAPYFQPVQIPSYAAELGALNESALYVTPARPLTVSHELATFKFASNAYHVEMLPTRTNVPTFGRAKEIAVGSRFAFAILFEGERPSLPRWIRLGLWRSKALVSYHEAETLDEADGKGASLPLSYAMNPLDLPDSGRLTLYDLISMRPTSVLDNVRYDGPLWVGKASGRRVPMGISYRFPAP